MIQAGFFSVFNFIANNKAAQIVLTVGLILFAWRLNNGHQRRIGGDRREAKIEKKSRRVQRRLQEENNERLEKAERTRADFRATDVDDFGGLSNAAIERITRSAERGGQGEG